MLTRKSNRAQQLRHRGRLLGAVCWLIAASLLWLAPRVSHAREITHVVRKDQLLGAIAQRYHTSVSAIRKRNRLRSGQKIYPGQRLRVPESAAHRAWRVSQEKKSAKRNRIESKTRKKKLRSKRQAAKRKSTSRKRARNKRAKKKRAKKTRTKKKLANKRHAKKKRSKKKRAKKKRAKHARRARAKKKRTAPARKRARSARTRTARKRTKTAAKNDPYARKPKRPGRVNLVRYSERFRGRLRLANGKLVAQSSRRVDRLMRSLRTKKQRKIDRRLLKLLTRVSDHFGGRTIVMVSGYRPYSPKQFTSNSRHNHGQAIDFRVVGVPNEVLYRYCLRFGRVGCGYYPNSSFVHMDVRRLKTRWTDYSGPGQRPRYARKRRKRRGAKRVASRPRRPLTPKPARSNASRSKPAAAPTAPASSQLSSAPSSQKKPQRPAPPQSSRPPSSPPSSAPPASSSKRSKPRSRKPAR